MTLPKLKRVWTVAAAQANLPDVLRLAETEGPQYIGADPRGLAAARCVWQSFDLSLAQPYNEATLPSAFIANTAMEAFSLCHCRNLLPLPFTIKQ